MSNASVGFSLSDLISKDGLVGFSLCIVACGLALVAFLRLGGGSGDILTITDYVTEITPEHTRTFGYGGVRQSSDEERGVYANADVPFQSRAMSSVSFSISRHSDNTYWVEGEEDGLQIGGKAVASKNPVRLPNGAAFKSVGRYGSASFTAYLEEQPNQVRLHLGSPIFYRLISEKTRVSVGLFNEIVNAPIDEIVIRARLKQSQGETFILQKKKEGGFVLNWEEDLGRAAGSESEVLSALKKPGSRVGEPSDLMAEESIPFGTTIAHLSGNTGSYLFAANAAWVFGLKLPVIVCLLALAFGMPGFGMHNTQVRLPHGPIIFGCVTVFAVVGMTLAARDYFLPPYNQGHFPEYSKSLFFSLMALYLIRIPIHSFSEWRWTRSFPLFLIAFILLNRPFEGLINLPSVIGLLVITVFFFGGAVIVHWIMRGVRRFTELAVNANWLRVLMLVILPVAITMIVTRLAGGHSALFVFGQRFHLPTIFTVFVTFGTALVVTIAESEPEPSWRKYRTIALSAILFTVALYYWLSAYDHGGTAILGVGVLASMWAASRKNRPWVFTAVLAVGLIIVLYVAATFGQQERLEIAWGGVEGAQRYFDEAVNLRTARDMARAGGVFGLYDRLYVPSGVSMNIHNDLVIAYVAGFFGLIGLLLLAFSYFLFYTRLIDGVFKLIQPKAEEMQTIQGGKELLSSARPEMPSPFALPASEEAVADTDEVGIASHISTAFALGLIVVFLFQLLWVFTATLWPRVPFSGLDVQPISASVISTVAFIVILLGSCAFVHNSYRSNED